MPPIEITLFIVMALVVGGLTMGGVTLVYFLDKWRKDAPPEPARMRVEASPFDRAA